MAPSVGGSMVVLQTVQVDDQREQVPHAPQTMALL